MHELAPLYKLFLGLFFVIGIYLILINIPVLKFRNWFTNNLIAIFNKSLFIKINIELGNLHILHLGNRNNLWFSVSSAREWYYGLSIVAIFSIICYFIQSILPISKK